jgi:tetratricopeptide (TPR) repeat protein
VEKGLKADPQNPDGWYDLGKIALKQSKPKDAIEHLKKALTYSPQHNGALHQIERALRADGRIAEADRTKDVLQARLLREREELRLEEHVEHNQQDWEAQAKLAEIYLLNNKRGLAMLLIEKLKNNDPNNPKLPQLTQMLGGQTATGARQP